MVELLGYIVLVGSVFTLLSSTTFLISRASQKTYIKNRLSIASSNLYGSFLSMFNILSPDTVSIVDETLIAQKLFYYDDDGNKQSQTETNKYVYSFDSTNQQILLTTTMGDDTDTVVISISSGAKISAFTYSIENTTETMKTVTISGTLIIKKDTQDFAFRLPVYLAN